MVVYVDGLRGKWFAQRLPVDAFLAQQAAAWGSPSFSRFELLKHDDEGLVTPYYDYDAYELDGANAHPEQHLQKCLRLLHAVYDAGLATQPGSRILWGSSHGVVADGRFKVSFRFWAWGFAIRMADIPAVSAQTVLDGVFDGAVYNRQQKLRIPGACKGDGDVRTLDLPDRADARFCLAQMPDPDAMELQAPTGTPTSVLSAGDLGAPPEWADIKDVLETHGFINAVYKGRREQSITFTSDCLGLPCPCGCGSVHTSQNYWTSRSKEGLKVKSYSKNCKLMMIQDPTAEAMPEMIVPACPLGPDAGHLALQACGLTCQLQSGKDSINRDCMWAEQHMEECPTCRAKHISSMWYVYPHAVACWSMRNADIDCQERFVAGMKNDYLLKIVRNPLADQAYVDLYLSELQVPIISNGKTVYRFNGVTWLEWTDARMKTDVQTWLKMLMERLLALVSAESQAGVRDPRVDHPAKMFKQLQVAEKHVNCEKSVTNFASSIKRANGVYDEHVDESLNADPYTLGCNNGVVDLRTCEFRPARPEDRVTMTVGYDYAEHVDPVMEAEVQDFMDKCYPVQEEQEMLRRFAGYLTLGMHNEKVLLLLTDERQGYNAKSTVLALLASTLGQYATKADPALIYKTDGVRNINEHSSGLLAFEKTRFAYLEECDGSKILNDSMIKDYNGGSTRVTGRQAHDSKIKDFPWITKMAMCFNTGSCPAFNVDDEALVERMLTICHRSRFYVEDVPDIPYSFKADTNIKNHFVGERWLPYMLRWCLKGLRDYHAKGFRNVPESCKAFKKKLVAEKDYVGDFIRETVEAGGPKDYTKVKELYNDFDQVFRAKQRDRKTHKTLTAFQGVLARCYPDSVFCKKATFRDADGKIRNLCSVYRGVKRKLAEM